jgi:glycosyltransferase involved in cell wall biosynthesis
MKLPRISVVIITFNQEDTIRRAIDSVLSQSSFVYEIIISDDTSVDNTYAIIKEYGNFYPDLIRMYRNETNLGIFGHIEKTWSYVSGDLVFYLAGDDEFKYGIFEKSIDILEKENIDFLNDLYCVLFDFEIVRPDGTVKAFSNSKILKYNPVSLKLRNLVYSRSFGISSAVLKKHKPVRKDIGIFADGLLDIQPYLLSERFFYTPFIGSVYYSGIGISSRTSTNDSKLSYLKSIEILANVLQPYINSQDSLWLVYLQNKIKYEISPNRATFLQLIKNLYAISTARLGWGFLKREYSSCFKLFVNSFTISH